MAMMTSRRQRRHHNNSNSTVANPDKCVKVDAAVLAQPFHKERKKAKGEGVEVEQARNWYVPELASILFFVEQNNLTHDQWYNQTKHFIVDNHQQNFLHKHNCPWLPHHQQQQ